jgi:succinate-semialdehyde dehydrogenase/glutarate-semialdehyde dehydrogenase
MRPTFQAVDPATGEKGRVIQGHTRDEALEIARASHRAFDGWRRLSFAERGAYMAKVATELRNRRDDLAAILTAEMGKTLTDGRAEAEKCANAFDYYAKNAAAFLADRPVEIAGGKAKVVFRPLGTVLAVMPWNFPLWQVFRFAAPTLMAGNTAVLKHASNVMGSALAIEDIFKAAGFPADVFRTLLIPSADVAAIIEDPAIAAISLTGSVDAGRKVASQAGAALKKCVLELGGSDAYLVLEDIDVEKAAQTAAAARLVNAGQSCVAGKRFIVLPQVREAFEAAFVKAMEASFLGDPRLEDTKLGPLQSVVARDAVHDQVQRSIAAGARLLTGGKVPDKPGAWYPPTVLTDVGPGMAAYEEEVFGPVAAVIHAKDEADAIRIANSSEFGLGSGVLTGDKARGERIAADELDAGMSFVNKPVASDPHLPFGGVKHSGYGRELGGGMGIREFVNAKTVFVAE